MSVSIKNLENRSRQIVGLLDNYCVAEYVEDLSNAPQNISEEFYMVNVGIRRRQLFVQLDGTKSLVMQSGELLWAAGDIKLNTGVKSTGDFFSKFFRGKVSGETVIKPEYHGVGVIALEPTYNFIILQDVASWGEEGMVIEDGMFLASDGTVEHSTKARSNISSAVLGNEGLFNLRLSGKGVVALESAIPQSELIEIELVDDVLKIDGTYAVCWSASLDFSVEMSSESIIGSLVNGEGLVNVYRGTGKVLVSSINSTKSVKILPKDKK